MFQVSAQEALRASQASAQAAEARQKAAITFGYYNLKIGPTGWHFSTALMLQATDNVDLKETKTEGDVIIGPQLNTQMQWAVTELNKLNLNLGIGYSAYLDHSKFSRFYLLPGTALSFDVYVGDVWINLHDMVSITENSYQDPTVTGSGNYSQLANLAGVTGVWDWSKGTVRAGYDHSDYAGITGNTRQSPSSGSDLFYLSSGYAVKPETLAGLEVSGGLTHFNGTNAHDATQWSVGAFLDAPVSDYIHFRGSAGYTVYQTTLADTNNHTVQFSGFYTLIGLNHRLNQYLNYTISGGRTVSLAFYGGAVEIYNVLWQANWSIINKVTLSTSFTFERGTQIGLGPETFQRFGAGLSLGRPLTEKLSGSACPCRHDRRTGNPDTNHPVFKRSRTIH